MNWLIPFSSMAAEVGVGRRGSLAGGESGGGGDPTVVECEDTAAAEAADGILAESGQVIRGPSLRNQWVSKIPTPMPATL